VETENDQLIKMTKSIIYTIPGLGFDNRIFSRLKLPRYEIHHLDWIEPLPKEPIGNYALRMSDKIKHDPQNCILIGHSFGGIIAQEIAAHLPIKKIILISSIKSKKEKPLNFKIVAPFGLHYLFTKKRTLKTFDYWGKHFGYDTKELQELFKKMVSDRSDNYLQWSLYQLSIWCGVNNLKMPVHHIHGSLDKTFPFRLISPPVVKVEGGTHMMVYDRADEISRLIGL